MYKKERDLNYAKVSLFILLIAFPSLLFAQQNSAKYEVKGQAIDSISGEPISYATCTVSPVDKADSVVVRFVSDVDGRFSTQLDAPGRYNISVSYVGNKTITQTFTVYEAYKPVQLGELRLGSASQSISEVSVVAMKPLVKVDVDRITYDAQQDPDQKTATILDLLRKVPMVTVDGQDNVQLRGSSNFKYFLNGKPTHMFDNNPGQILKSMPANMVKNIEVITQPGAKYDAEGIGGIINIVTETKSSADGYSVTLGANTDNNGSLGGSVNAVVQTGKFSLSGNYAYANMYQTPMESTDENTSYIENSPYYYTKRFSKQPKTAIPIQYGSGQLTYEADTLNLFTLSFDMFKYNPKVASTSTFDAYDPNMNQLFKYSQMGNGAMTFGSLSLGFDYQHSFKRKGEMIILSYKWGNTPNDNSQENDNEIDSRYISVPQMGLTSSMMSANDAATNEHTAQADYTLPIAKGHTLEAGAKYIARINDSKTNSTYNYFDFTTPYPFATNSVDSVSNFKNTQDILGAYASYTGNVGKWSIKSGLRYEYTWLHAKFDNTTQNFSTNYGALVPSAIMSYKITDMQNVKIGYNMRIYRPGIWYLNPYVNNQNPNNISYGNPKLNPERTHNFTLGYSNFASKFNISTELAYYFTNNSIQQYSFVRPNSSVTENTYDNIGQNSTWDLSIYGSYRGVSWLNISLNSDVYYADMKASQYSLSNHGWGASAYLQGQITLPKDFRISLGGGGSLPRIGLQSRSSGYFYSYFSAAKDLLKKRLTISLGANFQPFPHNTGTTTGRDFNTGKTTFIQKTDYYTSNMMRVNLNVSYRIGSFNVQTKKAAKSINNDDMKSGGNNSGGQGGM